MELDRIEGKFIKENQLLALGFPTQGFVFYRVLGDEDILYEYTESPGTISSQTWSDAARLPMSAYSIDNILRVEDCNHVYQVFMGWSPGAIRQYLYYPYETARRNLDVKRVYQNAPFGYITGFESPYSRPSPLTELFIPKDVEVGFAWYNPLSTSETVKINLLIRRLNVEILRDSDLVYNILTGKQPCRLTTIGGIEGSLDYNMRSIYDVDPINLGADKAKIEEALAPR